jgi:hypothetical protein
MTSFISTSELAFVTIWELPRRRDRERPAWPGGATNGNHITVVDMYAR